MRNTTRHHRQEFERPSPMRWIVRAVLALAATHYVAFWIGGEIRERQIVIEAKAVAEAPRRAQPASDIAATRLDCSGGEVQKSKEHLYACYRRALSSRIQQNAK